MFPILTTFKYLPLVIVLLLFLDTTDGDFTLRSTLFALDNLAVTLSVGLTLLLAIFYYLWLLQLRLALINRLEKRLKEISQEKVFLMERHQKLRTHQRPAPGIKTDTSNGLGDEVPV